MGESDLRAVRPFDSFGCPVILVIIDVRPFRFGPATIFLDSRCHVDTILLFQFLVGQMLRGSRLDSYSGMNVLVVTQYGTLSIEMNIRRFLFQTWLGSGPDPLGFAPPGPVLESESRIPAVVFATKRGRELGCGVPSGVVEAEGAVKSCQIDHKHHKHGR